MTACFAAVLLVQVPRSQHGTVTQRVGTTDITISYNRPVARGRTLFGDDGVVHWGRLWHPGADSVWQSALIISALTLVTLFWAARSFARSVR